MKKIHATPAFYFSLLEFLLQSKQYVMEVGGAFDLTPIQTITLLLIDEDRPRPMKAFCTLFHCDASNVTGIVDGLEEKGLVTRQSDPRDRRIKVICLEKRGKQLQAKIVQQLAKHDSYLFDPLTSEEARQFVHIVSKLAPAKKPS